VHWPDASRGLQIPLCPHREESEGIFAQVVYAWPDFRRSSKPPFRVAFALQDIVTSAAKQLSGRHATKERPESSGCACPRSLRSHHSFCTASAVQEGKMQRGSLIRKNRNRVWMSGSFGGRKGVRKADESTVRELSNGGAISL